MKHCIFRGQRPAQPSESESAPFGRSKERAETRARRIAPYPDFPTYSSPTRKERGVPMVAGLLASSSRTTLTALCFRAHALPQSAISLRRSSSSTKIFPRNLFVDFIRIQCKAPIAGIWLTPNVTLLTPAFLARWIPRCGHGF